MYLKVNNKKLYIREMTKFMDRLIGLRFCFQTLDFAMKYPKKRRINTYFFFQKVDVILTDKNEKIIKLIENCPTEKKIRRKRKVYNIYFVPLGTVKELKVGEVLNFAEK
jgi:hypothetical protein